MLKLLIEKNYGIETPSVRRSHVPNVIQAMRVSSIHASLTNYDFHDLKCRFGDQNIKKNKTHIIVKPTLVVDKKVVLQRGEIYEFPFPLTCNKPSLFSSDDDNSMTQHFLTSIPSTQYGHSLVKISYISERFTRELRERNVEGSILEIDQLSARISGAGPWMLIYNNFILL